jgi:chromosome segregation ATPase
MAKQTKSKNIIIVIAIILAVIAIIEIIAGIQIANKYSAKIISTQTQEEKIDEQLQGIQSKIDAEQKIIDKINEEMSLLFDQRTEIEEQLNKLRIERESIDIQQEGESALDTYYEQIEQKENELDQMGEKINIKQEELDKELQKMNDLYAEYAQIAKENGIGETDETIDKEDTEIIDESIDE